MNIIFIENEYDGQRNVDAEGRIDGFLAPAEISRIAEDVINAALAYVGCPYEADISLLITDDDAIRSMNAEFRGIDSSTDVLSFPMADFVRPGCFDGFEETEDLFDPDSGDLMLGDIVISADHCIEQAKAYGHSLTREFAFLIAHSMLHLTGFDHMNENDAAEMERRQEEILTGLGISR